MSDVFDAALEFIKDWEGFDSDHPADDGGYTRYGISQAAHPNVDVPNLTWDEAVEIYRKDYWNASGAWKSPPDVGFALFDSAVQHGPVTAVILLQMAVGAYTDGIYGPKTEQVVHGALSPVVVDLLAQRAIYYHDLIEEDPSEETFEEGWMRRLMDAAQFAVELK